jgi:hypothetical protein
MRCRAGVIFLSARACYPGREDCSGLPPVAARPIARTARDRAII